MICQKRMVVPKRGSKLCLGTICEQTEIEILVCNIMFCSLICFLKPILLLFCSLFYNTKPILFLFCSLFCNLKPNLLLFCSLFFHTKPILLVLCYLFCHTKPVLLLLFFLFYHMKLIIFLLFFFMLLHEPDSAASLLLILQMHSKINSTHQAELPWLGGLSLFLSTS